MQSTVTIHSGIQAEISDKPYWHVIGSAWAWLFHNNVRCGHGTLTSVSAMISGDPLADGTQSPYSMAKLDDPKELLFEQVRAARYATLPTRLKSLYVFDEYALVQRAKKEWFASDPKVIHECRIVIGATLHSADALLLNGGSEHWETNANLYWSGHMTEQPFRETLVRGTLYFPNWQSLPAA